MSEKDKEAANNMYFLYTSPPPGMFQPSKEVTMSVPPLDLEKMESMASMYNDVRAYVEEKEHEPSLSRMVYSAPVKQPFAFLVSAVQHELETVSRKQGRRRNRRSKIEEEEVEVLPRLRSQRGAVKRRAASVIVNSVNMKRRGVSIDFEVASAVSEPMASSQEVFHSLVSPSSTASRSVSRAKARQRPIMPLPSPRRCTRTSGRKVGAYSPENRRKRIKQYLEKRKRRVWTKKIKYNVRKTFADSRLRVKGRFISKEDEYKLREMLMLCV